MVNRSWLGTKHRRRNARVTGTEFNFRHTVLIQTATVHGTEEKQAGYFWQNPHTIHEAMTENPPKAEVTELS